MEFIEISASQPADGGTKAPRGISRSFYDAKSYAIGPVLDYAQTDVVRGQDAKIDVEVPDLPPNADIELCTVELFVSDADTAPSPQHTGVKITKQGDAGASGDFSVEVAQSTRPSNVRVLLGDGLLWSSGGPLTESTYALPDASDALNAFLDNSRATVPLKTLPFVVQSDSSGKVGLRISNLQFSQVKTQTWPNPLDRTTRNDRTSSMTYGAIVRVPLDALIDQPTLPVKVSSLSIDVDGKCDPDRLLGHVDAHDGREFATVSTDYSIAQAFTLSGAGSVLHSPVKCTGVAACVTVGGPAELYAEIQSDSSGAPGAGAPLAKGTVSVAPVKAGDQSTPWSLVKFTSPVSLEVDMPYWLVLKAVQGAFELALVIASSISATPFSRQRVCVSRSSQIWKDLSRDQTSAKVALAGVVYLPAKDDQTAAAQLVISGEPQTDVEISAAVDPTQKAQTVKCPVTQTDWRRVTLELRCYAAGTLHLANVIQRFRVG